MLQNKTPFYVLGSEQTSQTPPTETPEPDGLSKVTVYGIILACGITSVAFFLLAIKCKEWKEEYDKNRAVKVEDNSEVYGQDEEEGQVQDENVYYGEVGSELTFTCCPGYLPGGGQQGQG